MKLDYPKAFTPGFGLFAAQLVLMIYNTYMPIFFLAFLSLSGVTGGECKNKMD